MTFPDTLPKVKSKFPIWTVLNCASTEIAQEQYGEIHVNKTQYLATMDLNGLTDLGVLGNKEDFTNMKLFEEWVKEAKYEKEILSLASGYMTN